MADVPAYYWDASALLSVLVEDHHTRGARDVARKPGLHLISSLAHAEASAVIQRLVRLDTLGARETARLLDSLEQGPWRLSKVSPSRKVVRTLSGRYQLRGADLWHLALLETLTQEHHPFALVSFDRRLLEAAAAEKVELA